MAVSKVHNRKMFSQNNPVVIGFGQFIKNMQKRPSSVCPFELQFNLIRGEAEYIFSLGLIKHAL
jgi:hypothetical protein